MGNIVDKDIITYDQWKNQILSPIQKCAAMERSGASIRQLKKYIHPLMIKWIKERKEDAAYQKHTLSENRDQPYVLNFMADLTPDKFIEYLKDTMESIERCDEYSSRAAYFDAIDREIFLLAGKFFSFREQEDALLFSELDRWLAFPLAQKKQALIQSLEKSLSLPLTRLESFVMHVKIGTVFWEENKELAKMPKKLLCRAYSEQEGEVFEKAWLKQMLEKRRIR